ncbi:ECF RNA polymerase sigma factor SigW [Rosistilla carotiformis]|uniref:ECF RNA polymerase sigma factor SigW n=1 Tax=Rosistilla carotiformis TaxID=2528017 RepID=A0A518JWX0_9BACT|nr:RNA polymerase sigma factor [Rosistilla carotiformis]QDV70047.1 ECF RNA polymerase sigma factor SigW [Rosistilla carotiformis]
MNVQNRSKASDEEAEASDDALIGRALAGEASAYDSLVRRHAGRLLTMIHAQVGNRDDAEDLMQETLAQAYFKLNTFAGKSSFFTWMYRIAFNLTITKRRKRRLESTHTQTNIELAPTPQDPARSADQQMADAEQVDRLRHAIGCLEAGRRTVLVMRDIDGMDYAEIAEVLAIPKGTVRSRLHRARLDLRELLTRERPNDED